MCISPDAAILGRSPPKKVPVLPASPTGTYAPQTAGLRQWPPSPSVRRWLLLRCRYAAQAANARKIANAFSR
jgi:hypothetical protein